MWVSSRRYLAEAKRSQGAEVERTYMLGDSAKSEMTEAQIKDYIKEACTHPMYPTSNPSFQIHAPAYTARSDAILCAQAGLFSGTLAGMPCGRLPAPWHA